MPCRDGLVGAGLEHARIGRSVEHDGRWFDVGANYVTKDYREVRAIAKDFGLKLTSDKAFQNQMSMNVSTGEMADAQALCERLRSEIADQPFGDGQVALRVTVSGGFVPFTSRDTRGASELLAIADKLLYEAKAAGRNRILFDQTTGPADEQSNPQSASEAPGARAKKKSAG